MSSTLPFLQRQLKPRLQELAAQTSLQGYGQYNKSDLAVALDEELRANQARYSRNAAFSEFYSRMARPGGRASTDSDTTPATARKPARRARAKAEDESEASSDNASPAPITPARRGAARAAARVTDGSPLSPRVVTDAIDQQTVRMRQKVSEAWSSSGMTERSDALRAMLSSVKAIEVLFLALEGACVVKDLVPMRYIATMPAVDAVKTPEFMVSVPDVFVFVSSNFWAPYSLWLLTSLVIPLVVAYFFNLSLKAAQSARGRAASGRTSFDPLSFNIAKALVAYQVYGERCTTFGVYSGYSVSRVNASLPGHWSGVLTMSAIGVVGTLYEAILRK